MTDPVRPTYQNDSLLITPELCESRNACREGLEFMRHYFPCGFTVDDVYEGRTRHIPIRFILDGYYHLPFTDSDKEKFLKYTKVHNSTAFYKSHSIDNCSNISHSHHCYNSDTVDNSSDVSDSSFVANSRDVVKSQYIIDSQHVYNSSWTIHSKNVFSSDRIVYSNDVNDSRAIFEGRNVKDSRFLLNCKNVTNSLISSTLANTSYKIFCLNNLLKQEEYCNQPMIFNQKVSQQVFDRVYNELLKYLSSFHIQYESMSPQERFLLAQAPASSFYIYTNEFTDSEMWSIIKDIMPFYDPEIAYGITYSRYAL